MKPYKKTKIAKTTMYRLEYKVETRGLRDWYWSEGINFYIKRRNTHTRRGLMMYQVRMYKTWKHNRKTQWK